MTKQERIQAIERIIKDFRLFKIEHPQQYEEDLATAIEEAIGVDEEKLFRVIKDYIETPFKADYSHEDFTKTISTNKEVITINENTD